MSNLPRMAFFETGTGRRIACAAGVLGGALALGGCVVAPTDGYHTGVYDSPGYYSSNTVVYTQYGSPPPPRVEYRTVSPGPGYGWVGGDWVWGGSRYDWRPGRWAPQPPRGGQWREPGRPNMQPRPAPHVRPPVDNRPPPGARPNMPPRPEARPDDRQLQRPAPQPQPPRAVENRTQQIQRGMAERQRPSERPVGPGPDGWAPRAR